MLFRSGRTGFYSVGANIIPGVPAAAGRDEGTGAVAENRASGPAAVARGGEMAPWEDRSVRFPAAPDRVAVDSQLRALGRLPEGGSQEGQRELW